MIEQDGGTGNGGRVTLRDLHTSVNQLRAEILSNLLEERKSRHDLANRVMGLEIFKAGVEQMIKSEIESADETHARLENAITDTSKTLKDFITHTEQDRLKVREEIKDLGRKLTLLLGAILFIVQLVVPIILKVVLGAFGLSI